MLKVRKHTMLKRSKYFGTIGTTQFEGPHPGYNAIQCLDIPAALSFGCECQPYHQPYRPLERHQVSREVDSPGQSGSGNQHLGPLIRMSSNIFGPANSDERKTSNLNHRISYENLYSCRSKSLSCQVVVIFQWQSNYITWTNQLVLCHRNHVIKMRVNLHQLTLKHLHELDHFSSFFITLHHR